jgi:hypothetical protein
MPSTPMSSRSSTSSRIVRSWATALPKKAAFFFEPNDV